MVMVLIVKRKGHREKFDERKVYGSCYASCLSSHLEKRHAEKVATAVTAAVKKTIRKKKEISSSEIFKLVGKFLQKHNKDAAFMYRTHRDVS